MKKKVLIVDDSTFMRFSLKGILERYDFEVVGEAENGKVAVNKYMQLKPDIVTMDITMPEVNGIEAVGLIKEMDSKAKIVMISAMGQANLVAQAIQAGACGFVVKPYKEDYVIETLSKL